MRCLTMGLPAPSLLHKSLIIILSGKGMLEISCEEEMLFPSNGLFIGLDIINALKKDNQLDVTQTEYHLQFPLVVTHTFAKTCTFFALDGVLTWQPLVPNGYKIYPNASFGLSVYHSQ